MANLREAYDYAKNNPSSDFAISLQEALGSGSLDEEAQKFGIDTSVFKPQQVQAPKVQAGSLESFGAGSNAQMTPGFEYAQGATGGIVNNVKEAIMNPGETAKGFIKGIPGQAAGVTQLVEAPGKALFNQIAGATGQAPLSGLDYGPIKELTQPSNPAQETGYFAAGLLPVEKAATTAKPIIEAGISAAKPVIAKGLEKGAEMAKPLAEKATQVKSSRAAASEKKAQADYDNLVRAITQGKKTDIDKAAQAISSIDTKGIKTYGELATKYDSKAGEISAIKDKALELEPRILTPNDSPYIGDAIQQLKDYYTKVYKREDLAKISAIEQKFATQGLTMKETEDLAKLHGQDLNAFSPVTGELSTGLAKEGAENTRQGVKNAIRDNAETKLYKEADAQLSNILSSRDFATKMEEKVAQKQQKLIELGLTGKAKYYLKEALNVISLGTLRGAAERLASSAKNYEGNALDIEKMLEKRLAKFDKITSSKNEEDIISKLQSLIKETEAENKKMLSLPSGEGRKAIPLNAPSSKPLTAEEKMANDFTQNLRREKNIKTLPAPKAIQLPNTRGTANPIGRPYMPNEQGAVGGSSRAKTKLK